MRSVTLASTICQCSGPSSDRPFVKPRLWAASSAASCYSEPSSGCFVETGTIDASGMLNPCKSRIGRSRTPWLCTAPPLSDGRVLACSPIEADQIERAGARLDDPGLRLGWFRSFSVAYGRACAGVLCVQLLLSLFPVVVLVALGRTLPLPYLIGTCLDPLFSIVTHDEPPDAEPRHRSKIGLRTNHLQTVPRTVFHLHSEMALKSRCSVLGL